MRWITEGLCRQNEKTSRREVVFLLPDDVIDLNIRISENDLSALQRRAAREGIPYQTLIGSVLHKYASGFLKEAG